MNSPPSCDTFVCLPPYTKNNQILFGKNSDRPKNEVQEVVLIPERNDFQPGGIKCTYITVEDFTGVSNSVILSKPAWMWGAEMGANNKGVVIGNEAVWTQNYSDDGDLRIKRLLGMDLVRLGLEMGNTAEQSLCIITAYLENYGQGGSCSEFDDSLMSHNSFLIVDEKEAWVLETSGRLWVAERIDRGYRNISNGLTITTNYHKSSTAIKDQAAALGLYDYTSEFNFAECFSSGRDEDRQLAGHRLLYEHTRRGDFDINSMLNILRNKESRICRGADDQFPTQGSQVSLLMPTGTCLMPTLQRLHFFTGTTDPSVSMYKPFIFYTGATGSPYLISPNTRDREHELYKMHKTKSGITNLQPLLRQMEEDMLKRMDNILVLGADQVNNLLPTYAEKEMNLYRTFK